MDEFIVLGLLSGSVAVLAFSGAVRQTFILVRFWK
jgi:hypothetical protein